MYSIHAEVVLPCYRERVFPFFADSDNLEIITPEWLGLCMLSRGIEMKTGSFIDYRLLMREISIRWQSEITVWNPPHCFVDQQCRRPYTEWIHTHRFEEMGVSTKVLDDVRYDHLGDRWVNYLFVARDLEQIFSYCKSKL
jgi:ligand-binding SRPBCC domain-containing protein